jgi:hypothetical protein
MRHSTILENRVISNVAGTRDSTYNLNIPIRINPNKRHYIRLIKTAVSTGIPNIYTSGTFDNAKLSVTKDGGANWDLITLTEGTYTISYLDAAIKQAMLQLGYYTTTSEPPIYLAYNLATSYVYVTLDSTGATFTGTQIGIDFSYAGASTLWDNLGFETPKLFTADGTNQANNYAQIDQQGSTIDVQINLATGIKSINGLNTDTIATIPLTRASGNEYVYPFDGIITPEIPVSITQDVTSFTVKYLTTSGTSMYWSFGNTYTEVEVIEVGGLTR